MDSYDLGRLTYLVLLAAAVGGSFFMMNKASWGKSLQQLAIWALIFVGAIGAYGLWNDISRDVLPRQSVVSQGVVEVPRRPDGHFYLTLDVGGTPVDFVVDTGASQVVLTMEDAARIGIDPEDLDFIGTAMTANGEVRTAPVTVDEMVLGDVTERNVRVYVNEGMMDMSLLGMTYLSRFERIEIADDMLILTR
ncbi:TIGR02281 family clan AA aspartic protease [Maritimibacter sp. UBA3975]|mgnify:CR=1 FL=1|uniref:retropepsin-like aspartic protease family protein n=1 Tax=Maritimibacter sp. UBA3975 TaxID=1946833 RepID=UPI000C0B2036|nr:TIGR02281 family clan AA aspartic protease [Maritimibacter sp. UBA3975]MAM60232.1 TIGR02281 family clan AA aspartic protease [Maritimibacter sp.]|tara:strand:+ start:2595 stop:3173 length:579 start_codon:yes stop_codon:yes gene_type:complete